LGPIVPLEFAGAKVWHDAQPLDANSVLPAATAPPEELVVVTADVVVGVAVEPTVTVMRVGGLPSDV
jgi:hypothetical protein